MEVYSRNILAPSTSIVSDGTCTMGTFNGAFNNVNLMDISDPLGVAAPRLLNWFRLKEWQAVQINNDEWFICVAVYNTKTLGTAIIMAFHKPSQRMYRYEHKVPFWRLRVPKGLMNSHCYYHSKKLSIDFFNKLEEQKITVKFSAKGFKSLPDLEGTVQADHRVEPIVIVQPFDQNRPLYSHKALMPLEGTMQVDGKECSFTNESACMIVDDHKGFYPYVMKYDWVTSLGNDKQGRIVGFNLTDNQIQNPEHYNENCLWVEGRMVPLPPIKVERPTGVNNTWYIKDSYGRVSLSFTPLADVPVYVNALIARVKYHGPTGRFSGYILDADNQKVCFDDFIGMGEKKYIRM